MGVDFVGFGVLFEMIENPLHERRILNAGDDLDGAATLVTRFDVDLECPFESLGPGHGGAALGGGLGLKGRSFPPTRRGHLLSESAVGREYAVEAVRLTRGLGIKAARRAM